VGDEVWTEPAAPDTPYRDHAGAVVLARGSPAAALHALAGNAATRGACLLAFVAVAVGQVALAGSFASHPNVRHDRVRAIVAAASVRSAASTVLEHDGRCPTVEDLKREHMLDGSFTPRDAWGNAYVIQCDGAGVTVLTAGPDRKLGTHDDILVLPSGGGAGAAPR
jgi:hypothetical protein